MIFLGIDSGTQSTKAIAVEAEAGRILATASSEYGLIDGLPAGHLEQDARTWIEATESCLDAVAAELGDRCGEVCGIGVSGQQHGLVVLDEAEDPVRPAKLWCDTSTTAQCDAFAAEFGGQAGLIAKSGNAMLPGYTIPKLLWIKENEPENFERIRHVLLPHDYLNFWLSGTKRMEFGDASGTGVLDIRTRSWDRELLEFVDPAAEAMLPELGSSLDPCGRLREELAGRWGFSTDTVISAGGGDNMMGAIGTGNVEPGVVTASFGTSGTLYACAEEPVIDPQGEVAAFCDSTDHWLPLVCTMNVTVVTEQMRGMFGWGLDQFEEAVDGVGAGADGLLMLPYLNGERTPNLPGGSGVLHGMNPGNLSPAHLARAGMEGATLGLAYGLNRFRELGLSPSEIRLTGGGSQSPTWRQVAADAFDAEVVTLATAEGAGLGAAVQAAHAQARESGSGQDYPDLAARFVAVDESSRCAPGADRDRYAELLDRQSKLTRTLAENGFL